LCVDYNKVTCKFMYAFFYSTQFALVPCDSCFRVIFLPRSNKNRDYKELRRKGTDRASYC
jgi:hypothetical protein